MRGNDHTAAVGAYHACRGDEEEWKYHSKGAQSNEDGVDGAGDVIPRRFVPREAELDCRPNDCAHVEDRPACKKAEGQYEMDRRT